MGSLGNRLARLEDRSRELSKERQPRSPEHVYDRIRQEAREDIAECLARGEKPLYRIAENGDVLAADGRVVNHYGDFIRVLDEHIAGLEREIADLPGEAEEETT